MTQAFQLRWPVEHHIVTQYFGDNPTFYTPFGLPGHEGLDFYAPLRAQVFASAGGDVYWVGHPSDHPYGLHVRLKHTVGDAVYRTIYAHLDHASVTAGQQVQVGDGIGLADNTGNSFGSHLHLTLKVDGAQTPGYPARIVDPWPYFQQIVSDLPPVSELIVYPSDQLSLRSEPTVTSGRLAVLAQGEALTVLGDAEATASRIGREGEWLHVQTTSGLSGFVAAWYVRLAGGSAPASPTFVFPTNLLSVRVQPSVDANRLTTVTPNDALQVLGDPRSAMAKIGDAGEWLNIRAPSGHVGYVAAWFVRLDGPLPVSRPNASPALIVYPVADLNLRSEPSSESRRVGLARFNTRLTILDDDPEAAKEKIGREESWLFVETDDKEHGWAAAWFLSLTQV